MTVDSSEKNGKAACRLLSLNDVGHATNVISQAFVDDPLCTFMLPHKATRIKTLTKFFQVYGEIYIRNLHGYGVGEPLQKVAFWIPPNANSIPISIKSLGLFIPLLFTHYPIGYIRARVVLRQTDILHQKYAGQSHYHLDNIGVLPAEQGKGLSSRLIRPILKKADEEKVAVYTDTVTKANVAL